jgi:hypothetical protein
MKSRRPPPPIETAAAVPILGMAVVADAPPRRSRRRVLGGSLLAAGAVAILAARTLLAPGVSGSASPAPLPPPPPVGSCVLVVGEQVDVVPCDLPHSGEVTAAWAAGERPLAMVEGIAASFSLTVSVRRVLPMQPEDQVCAAWAEQYVGWTSMSIIYHGSGRWVAPQPVVAGQLIEAPPGQGTPDRHWSACIVRTQQPLYTGTVRTAAFRTGEVPGEMSICVDIGVSAAEFVGCDLPHQVEMIAVMALSMQMMLDDTVAVEHTDAEIRQQCVDIAARRTGSSDPSYRGQLEVVAESVWAQREEPLIVGPPSWLVPDCLIRVVGSGKLVESVLGHGDQPLPWQN